ncbi:MAG: HPr family phosphocarrier protein [Lachnospiraceae bacterium]|nr:HPr family phosphocarrier protein [Lachnospiraceae bacterium]
MLEFKYEIEDPSGIHARAAGLFVREAVKHPCAIHVMYGKREVDGKSLLALMGMKVPCGETLCIRIDGKSQEEEEATKAELLRILQQSRV